MDADRICRAPACENVRVGSLQFGGWRPAVWVHSVLLLFVFSFGAAFLYFSMIEVVAEMAAQKISIAVAEAWRPLRAWMSHVGRMIPLENVFRKF